MGLFGHDVGAFWIRSWGFFDTIFELFEYNLGALDTLLGLFGYDLWGFVDTILGLSGWTDWPID